VPSATAKWVIVVRKAGLGALLGMDTELRFLLLMTKREVSRRDLIPKKIEFLLFYFLTFSSE